jgi:hypothetical protein
VVLVSIIASGIILFVSIELDAYLAGAMAVSILPSILAALAFFNRDWHAYIQAGMAAVVSVALCTGLGAALRPERIDREVGNGFYGFVWMFLAGFLVSSICLVITSIFFSRPSESNAQER